MRFKEFLLTEQTDDLLSGLEKIKIECAPFLKDNGFNGWLYRGMKDQNQNRVFQLAHPDERKGVNSSAAFNLFFNFGIKCAFGIPNVRKRSIFATGDIEEASFYGTPYVVFPKDYKCLWSRDIADSYIGSGKMLRRFNANLISAADIHVPHEPVALNSVFGQLSKWVDDDDKKLTDQHIEDAFGDYQVEAEHVEEALAATFKSFYKEGDIAKAINSQNEIIIYESAGIFYVPVELIKSHIAKNPELEGQSVEEFLSNYFGSAGA